MFMYQCYLDLFLLLEKIDVKRTAAHLELLAPVGQEKINIFKKYLLYLLKIKMTIHFIQKWDKTQKRQKYSDMFNVYHGGKSSGTM